MMMNIFVAAFLLLFSLLVVAGEFSYDYNDDVVWFYIC
jgi:hypothetical protein